MRPFTPGAVGHSRLEPPRPALTLIRFGPRDALRLQSTHPRRGVERGPAYQSGIDDHPDPFDGQAGLCNVGSEHDLALTRRRRRQRGILLLSRQVTEQREDAHRPIQLTRLQERLNATDLSRSGKEDEEVARLFMQGPLDELRRDLLRSLVAPRGRASRSLDIRQQRHALANEPRFNRIDTTPGGDNGGVVQHSRDGRTIQRRRHDQNLEVGRQAVASIECQCKAEVRLQTALVELVEDDDGEFLESRILLQDTSQYALGNDLDTRISRHAGVHAHSVADRASNTLAERPSHALGDRTRCEPSRLQHHDPLAARPRLLEEHQRHDGALACARRRLQHGGPTGAKCLQQIGEDRIDR